MASEAFHVFTQVMWHRVGFARQRLHALPAGDEIALERGQHHLTVVASWTIPESSPGRDFGLLVSASITLTTERASPLS